MLLRGPGRGTVPAFPVTVGGFSAQGICFRRWERSIGGWTRNPAYRPSFSGPAVVLVWRFGRAGYAMGGPILFSRIIALAIRLAAGALHTPGEFSGAHLG